jgi:prepilin-type N-terminal cleavage/methylation domain-containing protein
MRSEFKAKLIQHMLNKKGSEKGFTLIELLVVIIIIGILAAIALPSFLNQANKARQSEARTYVGSINRAQQAYYLEKQQFAPNLANAAVGIPGSTENYAYAINRFAIGKGNTSQRAFAYALPIGTSTTYTAGAFDADTSDNIQAAAPGAAVKAYIGATNILTPTGTLEPVNLAALCEANQPGVTITSLQVNSSIITAIDVTTTAAPACVTGAANSTAFSGIS